MTKSELAATLQITQEQRGTFLKLLQDFRPPIGDCDQDGYAQLAANAPSIDP